MVVTFGGVSCVRGSSYVCLEPVVVFGSACSAAGVPACLAVGVLCVEMFGAVGVELRGLGRYCSAHCGVGFPCAAAISSTCRRLLGPLLMLRSPAVPDALVVPTQTAFIGGGGGGEGLWYLLAVIGGRRGSNIFGRRSRSASNVVRRSLIASSVPGVELDGSRPCRFGIIFDLMSTILPSFGSLCCFAVGRKPFGSLMK